jgi:hypothetical protein
MIPSEIMELAEVCAAIECAQAKLAAVATKSRDLAMVATKLDEAELWLGRAATEAASRVMGKSAVDVSGAAVLAALDHAATKPPIDGFPYG